MIKIPKISLFSLLIVLPVFFSYGDYGFGIDRVGGLTQGYHFTIPISLIVAVLISVKSLKFIVISKNALYFFYFSIIIISLKTLYNLSIDVSIIKTLIFMNIFITLNIVFQRFFEIKVSKFRINNYNKLKLFEKQYVIYPLVTVLLLTVFSNFDMGRRDSAYFVLDNIKIYNFEQYFGFIFLLLLGATIKFNYVFFMCLAYLSWFILNLSSNITCILIFNVLIGAFFINLIVPLKNNHSIYYLLIFSVVIFFVSAPFVLFVLHDHIELLQSYRSLTKRFSMIDRYFSNITWYQILFPFLSNARSIYQDMHNEFLEVFNATGIYGIVFYYYFIVKRLVSFASIYRFIGFTIAMIIFIGGITVVNTLHQYMLIILSYIISFYYVVSKKYDYVLLQHYHSKGNL